MAEIPGVTYIDKHPQPTHDTAKTLQVLIQKYAKDGGLDAVTVVSRDGPLAHAMAWSGQPAIARHSSVLCARPGAKHPPADTERRRACGHL